MRSVAPALLLIFRSRHQIQVLTLLLLHPDREYSLTELATTMAIPLTTAQRDVDQLVETGVVAERRAGRTRLLRANQQSRYVRPLTELVTLAFGPQVVVADEFASIAGIEAVAVYGSWAARYQDQPGPPPNDIDVLVIGQPERGEVYAAADRVQHRISLPVNPTVYSRQRWNDSADAFARELKSAPLVWALGSDPVTEVA